MLIGTFTARVSRTLWTKPVTIENVILNRMRVIAKSLFITHSVFVTIVLFSGAGIVDDLEEIPYLLTAFIGVLIASWCMIWVPYLPFLYWVYLLCCLAVAALSQSQLSDFWYVAVPEVVFLILLIWAERVCMKRKLFKRKVQFVFIGLAVCIFAISIFHLYLLDNSNADWFNLKYASMALVFSLMPLFCLLSQGVFLDRMRHGVLIRSLPPRETQTEINLTPSN